MDVDHFVSDVAGCGPFQILLFLAIYGSKAASAWINHFMVFGSYNPGWKCSEDAGNESTGNVATNLSIVVSQFLNATSTPKSKLEIPYSASNTTAATGDICDVFSTCPQVTFYKPRTIVTEWGLVCNRARIVDVIISCDMAGLALGSWISGPVADRFGRKRCLLFSLGFSIVSNITVYFSLNWYMFTICRFCSAVFSGAISCLQSLYLFEFSTLKWRVVVMTVPAWNVNVAIFGVLVYLFESWTSMQLAIIAVSVVAFVTALWLPESLRWLAVHGKTEEAKAVAYRFCKYNRKPIPDESQVDFTQSEGKKSEKKANILILFRKSLLKKTILVNAIMMTIAVTYYALYFGVRNLHGNFYLNLILFSIITIPFAPLTPVLAHKVGRRGGNLILLGLSATLSFVIVIVCFVVEDAETQGWTVTFLALSISVCLDQGWCLHQGHSAELFPTSLRASSYSLLKMFSRLGGIIAPYVIPTTSEGLYVYYIISGALLLVCCLMLYLLPDTMNKPMNDTILQLEREVLNCENEENTSHALINDPTEQKEQAK